VTPAVQSEGSQPRWLDPVAAANYLGLSVRSLANMRQMRTGPAFYRVSPKIVRYAAADLDAYLAARRVAGGLS
jgi:Helix-turn-helix domain